MKTFVLMMVSLLFAISSEAQNKSFYDFIRGEKRCVSKFGRSENI